MPVFVKAAIWVCVAVMYVLQISPVFYRAAGSAADGGSSDSITAVVAAVIMAAALIIESIADKQKSAAKEKNPGRFCDTGLYRIVRCPNYLGEVLFWGIAVLGYILIVYVMFSGAKRLEIRQNKNYGADPEYRKYVESTPILIPLVPLYHLKDIRFIVA